MMIIAKEVYGAAAHMLPIATAFYCFSSTFLLLYFCK